MYIGKHPIIHTTRNQLFWSLARTHGMSSSIHRDLGTRYEWAVITGKEGNGTCYFIWFTRSAQGMCFFASLQKLEEIAIKIPLTPYYLYYCFILRFLCILRPLKVSLILYVLLVIQVHFQFKITFSQLNEWLQTCIFSKQNFSISTKFLSHLIIQTQMYIFYKTVY